MSVATNGVANPKVGAQAEDVAEITSQSDDNMIRVRRGNNVRAYVTVVVLFIINLLNYMDRQTVAGKVLYESKQFIRDNEARWPVRGFFKKLTTLPDAQVFIVEDVNSFLQSANNYGRLRLKWNETRLKLVRD